MTRFYVGQRVRIKWSYSWPELAGKQGIVTGFVDKISPISGLNCEYAVTPDGYESNRLPHKNSKTGFHRFCPNRDQLEPITDTYDKTSWDKCVWKPEQLRTEA